jgi:hypothetical protein
MGLFERYLTVWVGLGIVAGVGLGLWMPSLFQAVAALEDLGTPPADAVAELTPLAAATNPLTAYWAITLLGRSGQDAASAVAVLADRLGAAAAPEVAQRAAWALGKIGRAASGATVALRAAAASSDPRLARLATEALAQVGG